MFSAGTRFGAYEVAALNHAHIAVVYGLHEHEGTRPDS
jgi:hypothetical protein